MKSLSLAFALSLSLASAAAQTPASTRPTAPVYRVDLVTATDSGVFANIFALHVLSNGGIIAVDASRRRMLVLDSSLKKFTIAADTAPGAPTNYGASNGGLISYAGDSAAFVEQESSALITVDRDGKFGRITTLPHIADIRFLGGPLYGKAGFDVRGRLFYRSVFPPPPPQPARPGVPPTSLVLPDSAPVIRVDLDARRLDTIAYVRVPKVEQRTAQMTVEGNNFSMTQQTVNPISILDDWAYDRDGTVAVVRGGDYHVDWILPDGSKRSTPRMPMDWKRITDADKHRIVDSVKRQLDSVYAAARVKNAAASGGRGGQQGFTPPVPDVVAPQTLPDYYPALKASSRPRFDLDGNLWVVPSTAIPLTPDGGLLYDVVDRTGTVIKRVQLPAGRTLSNFGPGGIIYMIVPVASGQWTRIERGRLVK